MACVSGNLLPKFWFTSETAQRCFGSDSGPIPPLPVTHTSSRKQFFGKLLGVVAATSFLPKLFAKSAALSGAAPMEGVAAAKRSFELRHDARAVARRDSR
jgi:hypothetical protein